MKKIETYMDKLMPMMNRISENKYLQAISKSMMATLVVTIMGSISVLLLVFPIDAVGNFINNIGLIGPLAAVNQFTLGSIALYVAFLVGKNLVQEFNVHDDGSRAGIISLISFFVLTPLTNIEGTTYLSFEWLGSTGIFTAMITGLIVGRFFVFAEDKGLTIKMPETVPPMVRKNFEALIPGFILVILFLFLRLAFSMTQLESVHNAIYTILQAPLQGLGGNIWSIVILATIGQVFWFFGLHGTNLTVPIVQPILMALDLENMEAVAAGLPMPNDVGYAFFVTYTLCATAIGFTFMMNFAKSERYKALGKVVFPPAIFGISEPLVFGTPIVLNFRFAFPFIFTNGIVLLIAYMLQQIGILPPLIGASPVFGLPVGFHAAIQGSWRIIAMQIMTQVIGAVIYYPFFRKADQEALIEEQEASLINEKE